MKNIATLVLSLAMAAWSTAALAQGHGHGRPATTGIEHAESTANPHGQRGIEKAEAKQAVHKTAHVNHGKHKGKGHKKH